MNRKITIKNILISTLGTFFVSTGIASLVNGSYGADTISTFLLGALNYIDLPFWLASMSFNVIILLLTFFVERGQLGVGSFINGIGIGVMLRFLNPLMSSLAANYSLYSIFAAFIGPIFIGIGGAVYISSGLGAAALEALTNLIDNRTSLTIKTIRMLLDGTLVLTGFLLGAPIGIGTILGVILIGPVLELTLKTIHRINLATS
ncbi:MAG: hypothetical protein L0I93_04525 [Atopostipes suicloacalis]|nr:hypothetical protein [Atopostipes suicloacalis]